MGGGDDFLRFRLGVHPFHTDGAAGVTFLSRDADVVVHDKIVSVFNKVVVRRLRRVAYPVHG